MQSYLKALESKISALRCFDNHTAGVIRRDVKEASEDTIKAERHILSCAEPYYWSKDAITIALASLKTFPCDARFSDAWLTTRTGYWFLDTPESPLSIKRQLWFSAGLLENPVVGFSYYWNSAHRYLSIRVYAESRVGLTYRWAGFWHEGQTWLEFASASNEVKWDNGLERLNGPEWNKSGQKAALFFMAANLWLQQRIIQITQVEAPCKLRRRAKRLNLPASISVISLRKREYVREGQSSHSDVDWQYRWVVSGHWRNQFYPSLQCHKPIWIDPFMKGPDDKPLKESSRLFAVIR